MIFRIGIVIAAVVVLFSSATSKDISHNVQLSWALGALTSNHDDMLFVPVVRDTALKTGDRLLLFLEPRSNCFIYVIHISPDNQIKLMFPKDLAVYTDQDKISKIRRPHRAAWFKLEEKEGVETFFVLASAKRLTELEALLVRYHAADGPSKSDVTKKLQDHIRDLRRKHSALASQAEKPVAIAGVIKDAMPDIAEFAVDISTQDFYARTISIKHK